MCAKIIVFKDVRLSIETPVKNKSINNVVFLYQSFPSSRMTGFTTA